jgi:phage gp36-like protein
MSVYGITLADMGVHFTDAEIITLTDDENTGTANEPRVDVAIAKAESEFHLAAGTYYVTPISPVPEGLKEKLIDLAAWNLKSRRSQFLGGDQHEGKFWEKRRSELVTWLEGLSSKTRESVLPGAGEKTEPAARAGTASVSADIGRFTNDRMKGFF